MTHVVQVPDSRALLQLASNTLLIKDNRLSHWVASKDVAFSFLVKRLLLFISNIIHSAGYFLNSMNMIDNKSWLCHR